LSGLALKASRLAAEANQEVAPRWLALICDWPLGGWPVGVMDVGAKGLLAHGVDLERHDGHAVDDAAGGLAVQACVGGRLGDRGVGLRRGGIDQTQFGQQDFVHAFGGVVAGLVVSVDGALVPGDVVGANGGAPGQVLFSPQTAVVEMVGGDPVPEQGGAAPVRRRTGGGNGRSSCGDQGRVMQMAGLPAQIGQHAHRSQGVRVRRRDYRPCWWHDGCPCPE